MKKIIATTIVFAFCLIFSVIYASENSEFVSHKKDVIKLESKKPDLMLDLDILRHPDKELTDMDKKCPMPLRSILTPLPSILLTNIGVQTTFTQDEIMRMNIGRNL